LLETGVQEKFEVNLKEKFDRVNALLDRSEDHCTLKQRSVILLCLPYKLEN